MRINGSIDDLLIGNRGWAAAEVTGYNLGAFGIAASRMQEQQGGVTRRLSPPGS